MKISKILKTKQAEEAISAALVLVVLLILPIWGGVAMLVGSAVGLVAYAVLFTERLRGRGWVKTVVPVAVAAALGAAIARATSGL